MELDWPFPIRRPHAGPLLGNGVQGLMLWGEGRRLVITVGRSGFWDHRGGNDFTTRITYGALRDLLEAGAHDRLREIFGIDETPEPGRPRRPLQYGGGDVMITLPDGHVLRQARLEMTDPAIVLQIDSPAGSITCRVHQALDMERCWFTGPAAVVAGCEVVVRPTWDHVGEQMAAVGIAPPERIDDALCCGFVQHLPEDDGLALVATRREDGIAIAEALGADPLPAARELLVDDDTRAAASTRRDWWAAFWADVPRVHLPDPVLQEIHDYGLYKLGCTTPPHGLPCSLQGPFAECYQIIPWSNDYHFNINIQMIYWPLLTAGRLEHFAPLWTLVAGWQKRLRANATAFFGCDDAIMLPHAVDDRCQAVGSFWTGCIDHGCTAWMAQLAWLQYRHGGDEDFLRTTAWPLLAGAFNGYWTMLEETVGDDGPLLRLPVSVSPEFRGCADDAWGVNASFQLAACHLLADILPRAAAILGETPDARWARVRDELPAYALVWGPRTLEAPGQPVPRIGLWEGLDLIDSHRHHSHLAAIYPFRTIDPAAPEHADVVANSLFQWTRLGPGAWTGWCVPWAAILNARCGRVDGAVTWLHWWREVFVNEGRGTLHDAAFPGTTVKDMAGRAMYREPEERNREVMQLDAGCGALTAVYELLLQQRGDELHVLPAGLPRDWRDLTFDGLHAEGGFVVGATVTGGTVTEVRIRATRVGRLRLCCGALGLESVDQPMQAGEELVVTARRA